MSDPYRSLRELLDCDCTSATPPPASVLVSDIVLERPKVVTLPAVGIDPEESCGMQVVRFKGTAGEVVRVGLRASDAMLLAAQLSAAAIALQHKVFSLEVSRLRAQRGG